MTKLFMVHDIDNLEITVSKRKFHQSAMACTVLRMIASCLPYGQKEMEDCIDNWCEHILKLDTDLSSDDLGAIFRQGARFCDKRADNYRDEHATTEVYR